MAGLLLLRGPAGAGKSQVAAGKLDQGEADVIADFTRLHVALSGVERGPDGRYPVRADDDAAVPLAAYVKAVATRAALARGFRVITTTSSADEGEVERARQMATEAGATLDVQTVDPGEDVVRARLSDPATGELSPQCSAALRRWYG